MTFFLTYTRRQLCAILQFMQFILVLNVVKQFFFTFFHFFSKKICKTQNVHRTFALAFGTWVAMADTAPLNRRATKASALPIRA